MKYICSVKINRPLDATVALWENEAYYKVWQDGFKSIELLSGKKNEKGAKSKIVLEDSRRIELIETIISNNLPLEKKALYEHIHMTNTQTSKFQKIDEQWTLYSSEVEYTKFNGLVIKLVARLFPSKFRAQSQKWMDQFKTLAEQTDQ